MDTTPEWLPGFLEPEYFSDCSEHIHSNAKSRADQTTKKGDRNFYCVDCSKGPLCDTGRQLDHSGHHILQVRKASHTDAIRINDITKLLDITHIQTYTINGAKIVFLPSRPQAKPAKGAPRYCEMCHRSLQDQVRFCSLSCKLKGIMANPTDTSLTLKAGGSSTQKGNTYFGTSLSGDVEFSTISMSDETAVSDFHDVLIPSDLGPATPAKKRIRSTSKGFSMHQEVDRPMKNLKLHRQHAPGLMVLDHLMPQSPTSVLHHNGHIPETSSPVSAEPESSTSHDFHEVMSFRKRPRKSVPTRSAGVGIIAATSL